MHARYTKEKLVGSQRDTRVRKKLNRVVRDFAVSVFYQWSFEKTNEAVDKNR